MSMQGEALAPKKHSFVRPLLQRVGILPPLMVLLLVIFSIGSPRFFTWNNLSTVLLQSVYLILQTLAQTVALLTGGFDLSIGSSIALVSIVTSKVVVGNVGVTGVVLGFLAGIAIATLIGAVNGVIISRFGVSPFIVTLAMMSILYGLALIVTGGVPIFNLPAILGKALHTGKVVGIPVPWIFAAVVIALTYLLLNWTRFGRYWYAIGGNAEAARLSGIPVRRYLFYAYTIVGVLVGIGGVLLTARVGSGEPNLGNNVALESIAAAVLGGISLRGGEGSVFGGVLGAIFLVLMRNGFQLLGMGSYSIMVLTGVLLIFAIIVDRYIHAQ